MSKKNPIKKTYTLDGDLHTESSNLYEDKSFFRKMTTSQYELTICKLLMEKPHKNIVSVYDVRNDYVDIELLNTNIENNNELKKAMSDVKIYLQHLGITYIDWKLDNVGMSEDGQYKLFDFDASGMIDIKTQQWVLEPPELYSYKKAIKYGMETPIDIDNFAFDIGLF